MTNQKMLEEKILGSLVYSAAGDAMGAATENLSFDQIRKQFDGGLKEFIDPPRSAFAYGSKAGEVTDDFSQIYLLSKEILDNDGEITKEVVKSAIIKWSDIPKYFNRFAGPTTRGAIEMYKSGRDEPKPAENAVTIDYASKATNGSAMKISPAGLFNPDNIDKAIQDAVTITRVTHDNHLAISGACAIAAGVSAALAQDATLYDVIKACLYGAEKGEEIGKRDSREVGGASVVARTNLAISMALSHPTPKEERLKGIYELVGTGLHISEAVPAAIGIMLVNDGDPTNSVQDAVNIGYDTDTVATIVGAIAGSLLINDNNMQHYLKTIEKANGFEVEKIAKLINDHDQKAQ